MRRWPVMSTCSPRGAGRDSPPGPHAGPTIGSPAVYTADPSSYNGCAPATCVSYWRNAVTAKINVLTRNLTPTQGYTDTKTYALGVTFGGAVNTIPAFNDGYKRHVYY